MARARRRSRPDRTPGRIEQPPFRQVRMRYKPIEILSADQIEAIHRAALTILQRSGMRVLDDRARALFAGAGAETDEAEMQVRLDPALTEDLVAKAPDHFALRARNPVHDLGVGRDEIIFTAVGGPAYVEDMERGRRQGTYEEMCDYIRLVHSINIVHQEGGGPFEPLDLPAATRHMDICYAAITLTDKTWQPNALGAARTHDGLEMVAISHGIAREDLVERCVFNGVINTNSPLQLDIPMAEGLITLAEHGQCNVITPFTLAGAMSPVTLAGALAQQHAEALAGIALTQIVRPGVPVMYGGFTSNVDMKSGAPAFGTPEYAQAAQISGQLARRIGVPFRSSNVTAANAIDAQAAYESEMALWGSIMGGAHMINHAAGWLGGGLTASFEKLIIDAEMLQMMAAYLEPPEITPETMALEAIDDVGPGGHFFGTDHTIARYETAFYAPLISNWDNYDTWVQRGRVEAVRRANEVWHQLLDEYVQPPLDPAIDEALRDYMARRKREGGAPMN
ncbi:MAG: methyltransferase [Xanthomonadales bacterium]|nr:methyltransferase [Xanthomonadales bacterium]